MSARSKDLESHRKRVEDLFPYEEKGIAALLSDIYRVDARAVDRADFDSFTVLEDLKTALNTDCLTPRQRQVVALYYFCELTLEQVGEVLGVSAKQVKKYRDVAIERVAREMKDGGSSRKGRHVEPLNGSRPLYRWVNEVADGLPVYSLPEDVETDLLHWLSERGDDRAWETLFQRRNGPPENIPDQVEEYPVIHARQYKYRTAREIQPQKEVMPGRDTVGYYTDRDGKRRRIFKL